MTESIKEDSPFCLTRAMSRTMLDSLFDPAQAGALSSSCGKEGVNFRNMERTCFRIRVEGSGFGVSGFGFGVWG